MNFHPTRAMLSMSMNPHQFELNRTTRRMVCRVCGGVMNECGVTCNPARAVDVVLVDPSPLGFTLEQPHAERYVPSITTDTTDPFDSMFAESFEAT